MKWPKWPVAYAVVFIQGGGGGAGTPIFFFSFLNFYESDGKQYTWFSVVLYRRFAQVINIYSKELEDHTIN